MLGIRIPGWFALAALFTPAAIASADGSTGGATAPVRPRPAITALRVEQGPIVDGRLNDAVWRQAPAGHLRQQYLPRQNAPMTEQTVFRIVYDHANLYLGVWCHDSEPERIVARLMEREGPLWLDDNIIFVFDTFRDRRNGYVFFVNPNGARRDGLISGNVNENHDWDGLWTVRTTRDHEGWKAEAAIPFATLNFDPGVTTWGFNLDRTIQRKAESGRWSAAEPQFRTGNVSEAGELSGVNGLRQGLGLELRPVVLGRGHRERRGARTTSGLEWGGDVRYRLTPTLSATLSYQTDFAETEVDLRQINLTRFPLFFPEKRHFFLEDGGVFHFAGLRTNELVPYFSRRIGLSREGIRVPITVAGKISGQAGPYHVGVINAVMDADGPQGRGHAFAARVTRNLLEQSSAGLLFTTGDPNGGRETHLLGGDFRYRTTRWRGDRVVEANVFALASMAAGNGTSEVSPAFGVNAAYPNDRWVAEARFLEVSRNFRPALGFVPRSGVRTYKSLWSFRPRPALRKNVRQWRFTYENEVFTDRSNRLESSRHRLTPLFIDFTGSDKLSLHVERSTDRPRTTFAIGGSRIIPAGEHGWTEAVVRLDAAPRRPVSGFLEAGRGGYYHGQRDRYSLGLDILPWRHLSARLHYDYNRVDLPAGGFSTHLSALRLGWHFTPDLLWSHLLQYDSLSRSLGYHGRIRWEFRPGSSVVLILNQGFVREEAGTLAAQETDAVLKLGMVFRF